MIDDDHLPLVVNGFYQVPGDIGQACPGVEDQKVWAAEAVKIELIIVHSITMKHESPFSRCFRHCYSSQHNSYLLYAAILQRYKGGVLHSKLGV